QIQIHLQQLCFLKLSAYQSNQVYFSPFVCSSSLAPSLTLLLCLSSLSLLLSLLLSHCLPSVCTLLAFLLQIVNHQPLSLTIANNR
ncbi:hypothetical protein EDC96DRAFT_524099, partial [Choanephora cucurbitarum]